MVKRKTIQKSMLIFLCLSCFLIITIINKAESYYGYNSNLWGMYSDLPSLNNNPLLSNYYNSNYGYSHYNNYYTSTTPNFTGAWNNYPFNFGYNGYSGYAPVNGPFYNSLFPYSFTNSYNTGNYFANYGGLWGSHSSSPYMNYFSPSFPGIFGSSFFPSLWFPQMPISSNDPTPPVQNSYDPQPGDDDLMRGSVYIDSTEILLLESYPVQVKLRIEGDLPTPCHQFRAIVSEPNEQNEFHVEFYSLVDPEVICIQVLEPFDVTLSLGSYTVGSFSVYINGEKVEEFTI